MLHNMSKRNILIGCTGSVATIKLPLLIAELRNSGWDIEIQVIVTQHADHFFSAEDIPPGVTIHRDEDEWNSWKGRGDPVLHIELGKWADLMVIAPLDANSLAKMAHGLCDNLLLCTTRAWDLTKPLFFCPAMNTRMWEHPITGPQIDTLKSWGLREIPCVAKTLMCGDTGLGAMAEVGTIVGQILTYLQEMDLRN
ncbi:phosphopantothenoylcysteine decarboxylase [Toxorhynchites rutilus septentrionalis]|uniref:phosphopantothenoylcysteine decarboxylase n=1 Tax=Toxorhynchites rutilus septentrionalis TaxID=329112 RepID=UPI0024784F0E|nr:phosphopantothenoylcysteine decarboxylase [Toxorhynchites rutilus septentrionalis]